MNLDELPVQFEPLDAFLKRARETTAVYRAYDREGRILYIGISREPGKRLAKHEARDNDPMTDGGWFGLVRRIELDWYESRSEALMHEARLVHELQPRFNREDKR